MPELSRKSSPTRINFFSNELAVFAPSHPSLLPYRADLGIEISREREREREGPAVETFPSADSGTMEERFIYRILDLGHLNRRRKTWIGVPPPRFAEGDGNERRWVPMETTNLFTVLIVSVLRSFFPTYRVQMKRGERRRERRRKRTRGKQPRRKKEKYRRGGWQSLR